jgi:hypothetical protein
MYTLVGIEKSVGGEDLAGDLVHRTGESRRGDPDAASHPVRWAKYA